MVEAVVPRRGVVLIPTALLFLGGIAYGSMFSANKFAVEAGLPIFAYAFWQALLAAALLLAAAAARADLPRFNRHTLPVFVVVAAAGLTIPLVVFVFVADKVPPGILTLIVALIPTTTYLLALAMRMDRFRWLSVAGVALGFVGILLIVLPEGSLPEPGMAIWVVFALLVPLSAAVNNVFGEKLSPPKVGSLALAGGMMAVGALFLGVIMVARGEAMLLTGAGHDGLIAVLWATVAQAITYASFFEIIRRAGALFFALLNYVVVAAGLFWAYLLFGEVLSPWAWAAVAVLAISLALSNLGSARAIRARAAR